MSFDINPSRNLSNVQASHKSNDGGAGNTGYFQRGEEEEVKLGFAKDYPNDSFSKEEVVFEEEETESLWNLLVKLFKDLIASIKKIFKK
jgi:hypothetical protein